MASNEEIGSRQWMLDTLDGIGERLPYPKSLRREDLDQEVSDQARQLARVAFEEATEVLGHAEGACAKTKDRLQEAVKSGDDEEYDYAEEADWEANGVRDYALASRERALICSSNELALAYLAREQAKSGLDSQYSTGDTVFKFTLEPIPDQTYEALRQADRNFHQIRERVLGQIALNG